MDSDFSPQMVVIDLVDEPLPEGCSHTMAIRIWTAPGTPPAELARSAQMLALGFLERATIALRREVLQEAGGPVCESPPEVASIPRDRMRTVHQQKAG